jgi:hypothetical protein
MEARTAHRFCGPERRGLSSHDLIVRIAMAAVPFDRRKLRQGLLAGKP